ATEQEGIGPDAELREVALDVRPEVPLPPVAEVAAERTGKPAAQPERRPGAPRRSRASLRGRERVEIEHADPPRERLGHPADQRGLGRAEQQEAARLLGLAVHGAE